MSPHKAHAPRHPAPYPAYIFQQLVWRLNAEAREVGRPLEVLDPFAGIGRIHDLPKRIAKTTGVEIEPEWAECRRGTIVGDATALPATWTAKFDAVVTSPSYGNRLSDKHEAKDSCSKCGGTGTTWVEEGCADAPWLCPECRDVACRCGGLGRVMRAHNTTCAECQRNLCGQCKGSGLSRRYTYRHALGRPLSDGNSGAMAWGDAYRYLHAEAWREAHRVTRRGGLIIVNIKNHFVQDVEQLVSEWHVLELKRQGFKIEEIVEVDAAGIRHGANADKRVAKEKLIVGRAK